MKTWLAVLLSILCHLASVRAQDANKPPDAISIKDSRSPDGKKDLAIVDTSGNGMASGTAQVREIKTGKLLGTFEWSAFGEHATEDSFTVLWRPDSRAFAIKSEVARGYSECKVYALQNDACYPVQLPDFVKSIAARYHLEVSSKGGERPTRWLPGNRLVLDVYNRGFGEEAPYHYLVTLQLPVHPVATVASIRPVF